MRLTQNIDKSSHYLGRMSKGTSGTKNDKDTRDYQARSSSSPICVFTSEVCLSLTGQVKAQTIDIPED